MINFLAQKVLAVDGTGGTPSAPGASPSGGFSIKPPSINGKLLPTDVCTLINSVTDFIVAVSIPIAGVMILYGAFLILTAADNPKRFEDGKNTILYTVIGLAIILLAKGLVTVITQVILGSATVGYCSAPTP